MSQPIIEARDLVLKPFPAGTPINLRLQAGERWLLSGESGAGKSTLIMTLLGLISPMSGDILLNGTSLHDMPQQRMLAARRGISVVFSSAGLIPAWSGFDNLALPLRFQQKLSERQVTTVVEDYARQFGLPRHWLSQASARLSRQESALMALARAMVTKPQLLIIDNSLVMPLMERGAGNLGHCLANLVEGGCTLVLSQQTLGETQASSLPALVPQLHMRMAEGSVQFGKTT